MQDVQESCSNIALRHRKCRKICSFLAGISCTCKIHARLLQDLACARKVDVNHFLAQILQDLAFSCRTVLAGKEVGKLACKNLDFCPKSCKIKGDEQAIYCLQYYS